MKYLSTTIYFGKLLTRWLRQIVAVLIVLLFIASAAAPICSYYLWLSVRFTTSTSDSGVQRTFGINLVGGAFVFAYGRVLDPTLHGTWLSEPGLETSVNRLGAMRRHDFPQKMMEFSLRREGPISGPNQESSARWVLRAPSYVPAIIFGAILATLRFAWRSRQRSFPKNSRFFASTESKGTQTESKGTQTFDDETMIQ